MKTFFYSIQNVFFLLYSLTQKEKELNARHPVLRDGLVSFSAVQLSCLHRLFLRIFNNRLYLPG